LDGVEHLRKAGGVEGVGEKERHFAQFNIIFGAGAGERAHFFGRLPAAHCSSTTMLFVAASVVVSQVSKPARVLASGVPWMRMRMSQRRRPMRGA
jgi:hypothetical protein